VVDHRVAPGGGIDHAIDGLLIGHLTKRGELVNLSSRFIAQPIEAANKGAVNRAQLIAAGLSPSIFPAAIPGLETGSFYIFRTDMQLNDKNHLTARFNRSDGVGKNLIPGMLNTLERVIDTPNVDYALAGYFLISTGLDSLSNGEITPNNRYGSPVTNKWIG
jgi:hypothetical protein